MREKDCRPAPPPSRAELGAAVLTGAVHVAIELSMGKSPNANAAFGMQHIFNLCAALAWAGYVCWRAARTRGMLAAWGLTRREFSPALRTALAFAAVALVPLVWYGAAQGRFPIPVTFWLVVCLYPVWGLAQQFVLQALVARNLAAFVQGRAWHALATATLFSAAHTPNVPLMILTFLAGLAFTAIFQRRRNLWALGIVHGLLGAAAYYLVLGQDPGAELLALISRAL